MKKGNTLIVFVLLVLVCAGFTACENNIIRKWWEEGQSPEIEYIPVIKFVPQFIYETIIEKVPEIIFVSLPPETIVEYVYDELPPEIIYEIIIDTIEIEKDVIVEKIIEIITEVIVEKEIEVIVENEIIQNPSPEEILVFIKENPDEIIKILDENHEILKEIIKYLPPEVIYEYLTEEQIKYIISQQPPEIILQNISIIDIEYIIFAGESSEFNGPPGIGGATMLTPQEKDSNTANVKVIAKALINPNYMLILHGNANPVTGNDIEKNELIRISNERAVSVAEALDVEYRKLPGGAAGVYPSERVTTSGYGGERNLAGGSTPYAGLNRRVEIILFRVETIRP